MGNKIRAGLEHALNTYKYMIRIIIRFHSQVTLKGNRKFEPIKGPERISFFGGYPSL